MDWVPPGALHEFSVALRTPRFSLARVFYEQVLNHPWLSIIDMARQVAQSAPAAVRPAPGI